MKSDELKRFSYHFFDFHLTIVGYIPIFEEKYSIFRSKAAYENTKYFDQSVFNRYAIVYVQTVDILPEIVGTVIYKNKIGFQIIDTEQGSVRKYLDFFTGEHYASLVCEKDYVCLYLSKSYLGDNILSEMKLLNLIGAEYLLYREQIYILHSSMIRLPDENQAILFTAPSGTGKSTQAELWRKFRGAEVLNGDRVGVWKKDGIWYAGSGPWAGTSGIMKNAIIPLKGIVMIDQASINKVSIPNVLTKIKRLMAQITINPWDKEMLSDIQKIVLNICEEVPIWQFGCTPDEKSVKALEAVLYEQSD